MPEFIDPAFAKTSPKRSFSMTENERFGLVFTKTGFINSGTGPLIKLPILSDGAVNTHPMDVGKGGGEGLLVTVGDSEFVEV